MRSLFVKFVALFLLLNGDVLVNAQVQGKNGPCSAIPTKMWFYSALTSNYDAVPYNETQTCFTSSAGEVWYQMVFLAGGAVEINTPKPYTTFDSIISVYTGPCTQLQCVASDKNILSFTPTVSAAYYISIGSAEDSFGSIAVMFNQSKIGTQNDCSHAIQLPLYPIAITSVHGDFTSSMPLHNVCNAVWGDRDCDFQTENAFATWYQLYSLRDLWTTIIISGSGLSVLSGDCDELICPLWECSSCSDGQCYYAELFLPANEQFFLLVSSGEQDEKYYLSAYSKPIIPSSCESPMYAAINAQQLVNIQQTTAGQPPIVNDVCGVLSGPVLWVQIVVSNTTVITASSCHSETSFIAQYALYSGDCSSLQCLESTTLPCPYGNKPAGYITANIPLTSEPVTYYLAIGGEYGTSGSGFLSIFGNDYYNEYI